MTTLGFMQTTKLLLQILVISLLVHGFNIGYCIERKANELFSLKYVDVIFF